MAFDFEKLEVWNRSVSYTSEIFKMTKTFPQEEMYGLSSQMRKSASSIPLNIAEGSGRYNTKEFVRFLRIARGSLYETVTNLRICQLQGFISEDKFNELYEEGNLICRMLNGLCNSLAKE